MQVHTFIAESANEAVDQIRAQLGPDAVVLSVRKLPRSGVSRLLKKEQIEVVAGIEETPAKAPVDPIAQIQAEIKQLREELKRRELSSQANSPIVEKRERVPISIESAERKIEGGIGALLVRTGLLPIFAERIVAESAELTAADVRGAPGQISLVSEMLRREWKADSLQNEAAVHVFVGVSGAGKSTVLCKMLARTSLTESQPATVYQLDTLVTNTSPQPVVYSEILSAQFERTLPGRFEWSEQNVFVDVPGIALGDARSLEALAQMIRTFGVPEIHLVLNAAYESTHLLEQVRFFSKLEISDLVLTHLDEENRWGKIWNLVLGTNHTIRFLSAGQNIPGEFFPATPEIVLNRQFGGK